ncbi:MAG: hypothetical protein KatS3mg114_0064 [Planctomycetaceae bacterium]|nr:MAG: hypothetical protein KatS3mg114_0064 [Planctomycetaceae bacterium]
MQFDLWSLLRCPQCSDRLDWRAGFSTCSAEDGCLECGRCRIIYPVVAGIPRFVPRGQSDGLGLLWQRFCHALLDSRVGLQITRERFARETRWTPTDLQGRLILEVGCGAGRFTEILLDYGAQVVAVDSTLGIEVCQSNLGGHPRLYLLQAALDRLPLRHGVFDAVVSFGMLHRLADPHAAFLKLPSFLKPGGALLVDVAPPRWFRTYGPTAWLRIFTRHLPVERAFKVAEVLTAVLYPIQRAMGKIPVFGTFLQRVLPIAPQETLQNCPPDYPFYRARLGMCDRLTSEHHPISRDLLHEWLLQVPLENTSIEQLHEGWLVVRGRCRRGDVFRSHVA